MTTLGRELRKQFETTIIQARRVAEKGARKALEQLAVHHHEPYPTLTREQRALRNRLRAHGRQLGDKLDENVTRRRSTASHKSARMSTGIACCLPASWLSLNS